MSYATDRNLSFEARGMLAYMLADKNATFESLCEQSEAWRVRRCMRELVVLGYLAFGVRYLNAAGDDRTELLVFDSVPEQEVADVETLKDAA